MKLACSTWMMPGVGFNEKIKKAREFGFEGVEIRLLEEEASPANIKEILDALDNNGIEPCSMVMPGEIFRRSLNSVETRNAKIEHAKKSLDAAAQIGCKNVICPEYQAQIPLPLFDHPKRPTQFEYELLWEYLRFVDTYAGQVGTTALIEPINRYETHFYYTLKDAKKILDKIDAKNIFILADFFHMNMEEIDIAESIRIHGKNIRHVHLGDSNRMMPGQGHTDFYSGFMALKDMNYKDFLAMECSIAQDPEIEFPQCIDFLRNEMK